MIDKESVRQQQAFKDLKPFERNMNYDGVRGSFQFKRIQVGDKIDVIIALEALGVKVEDPKNQGFEIDITVGDAQTSAALAKTLKDAGFNFTGVKDVPSSEKGVG